MSSADFTPAASQLFFSKNDPSDLRLGDFFKPSFIQASEKTAPQSFWILGYPDDEGVILNHGRPGAAAGPSGVRRELYRMTPGPGCFSPNDISPCFDGGDLVVGGVGLPERHQKAHAAVSTLLRCGAQVITLGGGHDYGFPDMSAFCIQALSEKRRPVIINFDAHLDVRPYSKESLPHSGSPFARLLDAFPKQITLIEIGIQNWCNSPHHLDWAKKNGAVIVNMNDLFAQDNQHAFNILTSRIQDREAMAVSVCMDSFSSAVAPGASHSLPFGFLPHQFLPSWMKLCGLKPRLCSFYETAPAYDHVFSTCRLTASLIHSRIFGTNTPTY